MNPDRTIDRYAPLVFKIAARIHEAIDRIVDFDELVSMGIVGLLDAARRADPARAGEFLGYAFLRVRGSILDSLGNTAPLPRSAHRRFRAEKITPRVDRLEDVALPPGAGVRDGRVGSRELWRAIRRLPPETQAVLRGLYVEGCSTSEVARRLGVGPSSVSRRHRRALAKLRAALESEV